MSFIERIGIRRAESIPLTQDQKNQNRYEPAVPPAEGEEKLKLERQASVILEKDLSVATYNKYVDTMIKLLGTHKYASRGAAGSLSIVVLGNDRSGRFISFERSEKGERSITTELHPVNGMGISFNARLEEITLIEGRSERATDEEDGFANQMMLFDTPFDIEYTVPSFVTGEQVEIEFEREKNNILSLSQTKSYLQKTFDLYKTHPQQQSPQENSH